MSSLNDGAVVSGEIVLKNLQTASTDVDWESLSKIKFLTEGGKHILYTGEINNKHVVVKTFNGDCLVETPGTHVKDCEIDRERQLLAIISHPNIVSYFGTGMTHVGYRFILLEHLGPPLSHVFGYGVATTDNSATSATSATATSAAATNAASATYPRWTYVQVLQKSLSISQAMGYLHTRAVRGAVVLHRDLKSDNIALAANNKIKLFDFGLAIVLKHYNLPIVARAGTPRFMSPEVALFQPSDQFSEVYSFGIVLWEMMTFKKAYAGLNCADLIQRVAIGGERPEIDQSWSEEFKAIISSCWHPEAKKRPEFNQISKRLNALLNAELRLTEPRTEPKQRVGIRIKQQAEAMNEIFAENEKIR